MKQRLEEIRERAGRATEGPWVIGESWCGCYPCINKKYDGHTHTICGTIHQYSYAEMYFGRTPEDFQASDADFIAHARQDIPWLLEQLDAKEKELQGLREAAKRLRYLHTVGKDQLPGDSEIHYDDADCDSHCWLDDLGFVIDEIERAVEGE